MKNSIYIPSLSRGPIADSFRNNTQIGNQTIKFYSDKISPDLFYPHFLITAGHYYKKINASENFGLDLKNDNKIVLGDSGGYQIAVGSIKYSNDIVVKILNWLENNSNIAINLDIPPRKNNEFDECMKLSEYNFKYFYENQTNKTQFLSVLQGITRKQFTEWYNMSSKYPFKGWAIGGLNGVIKNFILGFTILFDNKEHLKSHNKYFHVLGTTRLLDLILLERIQKNMHIINPNIQFMTDSSSPSRSAMFGNLYYDFDYNSLSYKSMYIPREQKYDLTSHLPRASFYNDYLVKHTTLEDLIKYDIFGYAIATLHNFYFMVESFKKIQALTHSDDYIIKQIVSNDIYKLIHSIDEIMFSDTPLKIFNKYEQFYDDNFKNVIEVKQMKDENINSLFGF